MCEPIVLHARLFAVAISMRGRILQKTLITKVRPIDSYRHGEVVEAVEVGS